MARIRRDEQLRAAEIVGVSDVVFLGYPDGRVEPSIALRRDITEVIRRVRPERVLAQSPERNWERIYASHPDHLAVGEAAVCAVYPDSRNPFAHAELAEAGLEAWSVPEIWLMASSRADTYVDITDTFDRKVKALLCHDSQHLEPHTLEERMRGWGTTIAQAGKLGDGRLAEGFRAVNTR
jgi:LmbE family N-acetylglucosaminyl deacetylase